MRKKGSEGSEGSEGSAAESGTAVKWDTELAAARAREAYRYIARVYPKDAPLEPIARADMAVLEAQESSDWPTYVDALRELMRTAKREALKRERAA
jgi:hypothetical protein